MATQGVEIPPLYSIFQLREKAKYFVIKKEQLCKKKHL